MLNTYAARDLPSIKCVLQDSQRIAVIHPQRSISHNGLSTAIRRATHERLVWVKPPLALPLQKPLFLEGAIVGGGSVYLVCH